jgi:glycine/D-amino acid oxidase-like deaminating enzyme
LGDGCGFSRRNTFYFASSPRDARDLRREFECRKYYGFDVTLWERSEIADRTSIAAPCALHSTGDGQIDPFHLTQRLVHGASAAGLPIFANTCVTAVHEESDRVLLQTPRGRIVARAVVFATGYLSHKYLDLNVGTLHSTYAVVSEPVTSWAGWPEGCLIWETARPYFYARQTDDGRAMIGGEDTPYSDDHEQLGLLSHKIELLQMRFQKSFPEISFRPAYAWAGTFGESKDGLAYIGAPPGRDHTYFALGYGGNGITFSLIAARLIADLIVKRPNADAAVFRFGR